MLGTGAILGGTPPLGQARDEQPGGLEAGEDLARVGVAGQVHRGLGGDPLLARDAQQQVPLAGLQGGEHVVGEARGDRGVAVGEGTGRGHRVGGRGDGARSQHDRGRPALAVPGDGVDHVGGVGAGVLGDQRACLVVVQSEGVATDHGEVTEQLGHEPREGQVEAREQQQAQRLRVGAEAAGRSSGSIRGRQQVRVVDDHERPRAAVAALGRRSSRSSASRSVVHERSPLIQRTSSSPVRRAGPAPDSQGLAGTDRRHEEAHADLGAVVEQLPQPRPRHVDPGESGQAAPRGYCVAVQVSSWPRRRLSRDSSPTPGRYPLWIPVGSKASQESRAAAPNLNATQASCCSDQSRTTAEFTCVSRWPVACTAPR